MPKGVYKRKPLSPERKAQAIKNIASHQFKKGHSINSGSFKAGHKTNVGKKRKLFSSTHKKRLGLVNKGKPKPRGNKSKSWKGGVSPENKRIRNSVEFKLWREAVYKRDNWTCQKYKIRGGRLNPHHIKGFAQYPELRFAIDNGVTLSEKAHKQFHKKYGYRNTTRKQLNEFINQ